MEKSLRQGLPLLAYPDTVSMSEVSWAGGWLDLPSKQPVKHPCRSTGCGEEVWVADDPLRGPYAQSTASQVKACWPTASIGSSAVSMGISGPP